MLDTCSSPKRTDALLLHGAYCGFGARDRRYASLEIVGEDIRWIRQDASSALPRRPAEGIDLDGYLLMPGLINAHDHLQFALYPRLANPPYKNYVEWGEDIHARFSDVIARHHRVKRDVRLWWGGLRNLLCGVTTVCHHETLWPALQSAEFPIRVVQRYGWSHSVGLGKDLRHARSSTPPGAPFIVHGCEGVDDLARLELAQLDAMGLLDADMIMVHGLALDTQGISRMRAQGASLIVCPSSNQFLFGVLPDMHRLCAIENIAIGSDSPITASGDLLDELRFAIRSCGISNEDAYCMSTEIPARMLRLPTGAGRISEGAPADLIAIRDTGEDPASRMRALSMKDIEFVMIGGRVQLSSQDVWERLAVGVRDGLAPLSVGGVVRWLRAPLRELLRCAEDVLGVGNISLSGRQIGVLGVAR